MTAIPIVESGLVVLHTILPAGFQVVSQGPSPAAASYILRPVIPFCIRLEAVGRGIIRLFEMAEKHPRSPAIVSVNTSYTYSDLLAASSCVGGSILRGRDDLEGERIAFMVSPGFEHVAVQWGIWRAGGVAVPLGLHYPEREIEYAIGHAEASLLISGREIEGKWTSICRRQGTGVLTAKEAVDGPSERMPKIDPERPAMILFTSGTTSRPKGVLTTHANIEAQATALIEAWEWTARDHILHVLPLHHVHGIVNVLTCALMCGAKCEIQMGFDCESVWRRLSEGDLTLFMAVPTIYSKLIRAWEAAPGEEQTRMSRGAARLRLMVSGSAALPVATLERWNSITGHVLLERYGMTEIGMALSNPLHGERRPGFVGTALPGVEIRCVDDEGCEVTPGREGEIEVRGKAVFREYWRNPEATVSAFRGDWFRTGDVAVIESGSYRILGRKSVDIIKTGGFKVSALEIEEVLREHPDILDCAVVGVEDVEWGEQISAAVELKRPGAIDLESLRVWSKERLAVQKIPRVLLELRELPRNAMGKINKPKLRGMFGKG